MGKSRDMLLCMLVNLLAFLMPSSNLRGSSDIRDSQWLLSKEKDIGRQKGSFKTKKQQSPRLDTQNSLKQEYLQEPPNKGIQDKDKVNGCSTPRICNNIA